MQGGVSWWQRDLVVEGLTCESIFRHRTWRCLLLANGRAASRGRCVDRDHECHVHHGRHPHPTQPPAGERGFDPAENCRHEMEEAIGHADYLMGVTRERFRPLHAMAHWSRALRHDPQNAASAWLPDYAEQRIGMKVDAAIALHHPADEPRWGIPAPTISVDRRPAIQHERSSD